MRRTLVASLFLLSLFANLTYAQQKVTVSEVGLTFDLPQGWEAAPIRGNPMPPSMEPSDPLYLRWKRIPIVDPTGRKVSPGINVTVFNVPNDANVVVTSSLLMNRRGWPFSSFLTVDRDGLKLPNSAGYLTEFSPREGILLKVFVIHAINQGRFAEINLSASQDVFSTVEKEFRSIIHSLRLMK